MDSAEIFILVNRWMSSNFKALKHGAYLVDRLYSIQVECPDRETVAEARRLYHKVHALMHSIRSKALIVYGQPIVAFLPVARTDDETGEVSYPKDDIQYPAGCTREQRIQLQFERACQEFGETKPKTETKKPRRRRTTAKNNSKNEQS